MSSVRVVSQESVKPSSPTPPHLRTYRLSWIDQLNPLAHIPITLFYPDHDGHNGDSEAVVCRLKAALSETLTRFYPLAGRLVSNSHVDCNDEGVEFYQTRVSGSLNRAIHPPDIDLVNQLLPCARSCSCSCSGSSNSKILLSVQVNVFDCRGMAIGVCFPHKIADGRSLFHFLRSWAALAAGDPPPPAEPAFNAEYHFPANERANPQAWTEVSGTEAVAVSKRWVFDASQISAMKSSSSLVPSPTRVEAVVGLIWRCIIRARAKASRASVAALSVDVRGRMEPPCPDCCFGNHWILSAAGAKAGEAASEREGVLEERIRSAVRAIGGDYVRRLQGEDGFTMAFDAVRQAVEKCCGDGDGDGDGGFDFDLYMFTSWLRFPVYELDFGWGKPIWFSTLSGVSKNIILLMPRREDEGVEAWVGLEEKHMAEFERDQELLHLISN